TCGDTPCLLTTATNGFIGNFANFGAQECPRRSISRSPLIPDLLYINGWGYKWGVLDFAGGGPVELGSGFGGLAYGWVLGRRKEKELVNFRPHNVAMVNLGTFILWFGWLGFNGGCAYGANLRAIMAIWNSMLSPAFAGIVWCLLDYRSERKYSMVGFCSGSIAGLVATTAAAGYLQPWASVIMGIVSGVVCNYGTKGSQIHPGIDDAFDIFAAHAVGGIIGLLFNGIFASHSVIALDGVNLNVAGGWVDHNWKQLYIQFDYICRRADILSWTTPEGESVGLDEVEIGEYANDYIEVRRHFYDLSAFSENKSNSTASDLFVSGDKNRSSNVRKSVHRLRLEDSAPETLHEKNIDAVIELQPTSECQ
ncbi:ammonium transporter, partial [Pisolithus croceorrhizus]